jgi:Rrf2 family protein
MLSITKKGDYGLMLMTALTQAKPHYFISLKRIAREYHLPYKFLGQIALELKRKQLILSKEGLGGGYQLARPPKQITVGEVLEQLEGPIAPVACLKGQKCPAQDHCHHHVVMKKLTKVVNRTLSGITLADIVAQDK